MSRDEVVVVDLGGTHVRFGHLADGEPADTSWVQPTEPLRQGDPVDALARATRAYVERDGLHPSGVVLGVPVSLGSDFDRVLSSPNIRGLEGLQLATELKRALGFEVWLERDIALLLEGEWLAGAGRRAGSLLGVFIGTGVGGAFLQQGEPYRGASGGAVEIGHIPIRDEGRLCICGNRDCLEAYASGHQLRRLHATYGVPLDTLFTLDAPTGLVEERERIVADLARAVATAINLLDPEVALIGGGIPTMAGFPKEAFERRVRRHLRRPVPAERVALAWAELGWRAALHGARLLLERRRGEPGAALGRR